MKRNILIIFVFSLHALLVAAPRKPLPTHGRTHFIIGQPASQIKKSKQPLTTRTLPTQVLFSPDDNIKKALLTLINKEQDSIRMAIFMFTDGDVAHALIQAQQRGVAVELIVDPSNIHGQYSKIRTLQAAGIKIFEYDPNYLKRRFGNLMHNKFIIFGSPIICDSCVWTGSLNITQSAVQRNQENVIIVYDHPVIERFCQQFDRIKKRCIVCTCKPVNKKNYTNA